MQERIVQLRQQLQLAGHHYHVLDEPQIPDAEYDRLFRELQALEADHPQWITPDSPTQRVGAQPMSSFTSVAHKVPMLSIHTETDISAEGAIQFDNRVRKVLQLNAQDKTFIRRERY